jgi:hypothetical protein
MNMTVAPTPHLRRAGLVITIAALIAIGFETLTPQPGAASGSHFCLVCGPLGGVNSVLNVFLFMPLGIGLAFSGMRAKRAILAMCALSALIETAQLLVIPGRYSTLGDVITNSVGGALGFAIGLYAFALLRPSLRGGVALSVVWAAFWLAIQTAVAFGFSPAIPSSELYGEIAPRLGNLEPFRGEVVRASIGDVLVPDTRFSDSRKVRDLLLRGAAIATTVVPAGPTLDIAPIVRIADTGEQEIMILAQSGKDLVFGVRTGATVLRLRPPFFAVANALEATPQSERTPAPTPDTLTVSARYSSRDVWINTRAGTVDRRIRIPASLGWTMLLASQWFIEGTLFERIASAIWIACLLLPIGYWGGRVAGFRGARDATRIRIATVFSALLLLYLGLVAVPKAFGVTSSPLGDWLAALAGIVFGVGLAVAFSESRQPPERVVP